MSKLNKNTKAYQNKLIYTRQWDKANNRCYIIRINKYKDADLIAFLDNTPNKQKLIKSLLRAEATRSR